MTNWRTHADAATVELTAARLTATDVQALAHLRDAQDNIEKAIEALEAEEDPEDD